jgi:hypothetical protein
MKHVALGRSGFGAGCRAVLYGNGGLSFQRLPVAWHTDPLHLTTGLLPLTGGRLASQSFLQTTSQRLTPDLLVDPHPTLIIAFALGQSADTESYYERHHVR